MTPEILLLETMPPAIEAQLERAFTVHRPAGAGMSALGTAVRSRIRGIATSGGRGAEAALIDALPALEIVAVNGVGTDAVDLDRCRDRGIRVSHHPRHPHRRCRRHGHGPADRGGSATGPG